MNIPERVAEVLPPEYRPGIDVVGVEASSQSDFVLSVRYADPFSGNPVFAAKNIRVGEEGSMAEGALEIVCNPRPGVGSPFTFLARVFNFQPMRYRWNFGDGGEGSQGTAADSRRFHSENHIYVTEGTYLVTVSAENEPGEVIESSFPVIVEGTDRIKVFIRGPHKVPMDVSTVFTGKVTLSPDNSAPYTGHWWQYPGIQTPFPLTHAPEVQEEFTFTLPGIHYLSFTANVETEGELASDTYVRQVTVTGAAPLAVEQELNMMTGEVGDTFEAEVVYSGGIPVVNGVIKMYTLRFDWGDGVIQTVEVTNPYEASSTTRLFTHAYTTPGTFEVFAKVTDGAGNSQPKLPKDPITVITGDPQGITETFTLYEDDAGCAPAYSPESSGEITISLDIDNMTVTLEFAGGGIGESIEVGCEPTQFDWHWNVTYSGEFTGSFAWNEPQVAGFTLSGWADWYENQTYVNCFLWGEPAECPDPNVYDGPRRMYFGGTVDLATGQSTGEIWLDDTNFHGNWGD